MTARTKASTAALSTTTATTTIMSLLRIIKAVNGMKLEITVCIIRTTNAIIHSVILRLSYYMYKCKFILLSTYLSRKC